MSGRTLALPRYPGKLSGMRNTGPKVVTAALALWLTSWAGAPVAAGAETPTRETAQTPAEVCYQAARDGGRDAYACDLAVQVARDAGDRAGLVAALANRSLILRRDNRLEPALEDLNAALGQAPDDAALHSSLGNLLLRLGRPGEALAAHDQAVALAPDDPGTYYNRAFSHRALGDTLRAEEDVAAARARLTGVPGSRGDSRAAGY